MKKDPIIQRSSRGVTWLLVFYLSFVVSGCSFRPAELTPEEARILQTRDLSYSQAEIARAVLVVLQEMHYTLGDVDMGLGMITAERTSERKLAPISRETVGETEVPDEVQTFCLIAGTVAVVAFVLALIFHDSDDEGEDECDTKRDDDREGPWFKSRSHRHGPSPVYIGSDHSGPDSYKYAMTITMEDITTQQTRVRVTVQGQHLAGSSIVESGPVQTQEFYADFFNRLQISLNR